MKTIKKLWLSGHYLNAMYSNHSEDLEQEARPVWHLTNYAIMHAGIVMGYPKSNPWINWTNRVAVKMR